MADFLELCREKYTPEETELIEKSLEFATRAHESQVRESGEPYITHPLAIAQILLDINIDSFCVAAALLHDVVEDCGVTVGELEALFGETVATLVDGVTKLSKTNVSLAREERQAESTRKMFLAMARDLRVIVIKFADRLHNMRTLDNCAPEKRYRISRDTIEFYAPLADRLGMGATKCELEDLAFKYLHPTAYQKIKTAIEPWQMDRMRLLKTAADKISDRLKARGINARINGRPKHMYSIYKKMVEQHISLDKIYDMTALRVIVDTRDECYLALGEVHSLWNTMPGRDKDYIARPKSNGYQSLHTTLFNDDGLIFEVQIRTLDMHRAAEYGIAAHWMYKEKRNDRTALDEKLTWFREALEYQDFSTTAREFIDSVQHDFFSDYVFVLTPRGEVIDLPIGSTPLDFAYRIHTNVGNSVHHAKVNGSIVSLDYKLKTHDVVEIMTSSTASPTRDWLKMVRTKRAKVELIHWFKKQDRDENILKGHVALDNALSAHKKALADFSDKEIADAVKRFGRSSIEDLYAAIGSGGLTANQVASKLTEAYRKNAEAEELIKTKLTEEQTIPKAYSANRGIWLKGLEDTPMAVHFARCCSPLPPDDIFGYTTRGRGISIHRVKCSNAKLLKLEPERIIEVEWIPDTSGPFMAFITIMGYERKGLLADISRLLLNMNIDLKYINADNVQDGKHISVHLAFETESSERLEEIMKSISQIDSVSSVHRTNG